MVVLNNVHMHSVTVSRPSMVHLKCLRPFLAVSEWMVTKWKSRFLFRMKIVCFKHVLSVSLMNHNCLSCEICIMYEDLPLILTLQQRILFIIFDTQTSEYFYYLWMYINTKMVIAIENISKIPHLYHCRQCGTDLEQDRALHLPWTTCDIHLSSVWLICPGMAQPTYYSANLILSNWYTSENLESRST